MVSTANLIEHWAFDESSGNATGSHGSKVLVNNGPTFVAGALNNASNYVAASSQYFSIADQADISMGSGIDASWSFWFRFPTLAAGIHFGKGNNYSAGGCEYYSSIFFQNPDYVFEFKASDGVSLDGVRHNLALAINTWYHVVVTFTSSDGKLRMYVNNGAAVTQVATFTGGIRDGTSALHFGRYPAGGSPNYSTCLIDEWAMWKRVLSAQDRTDLYNGGTPLGYGSYTSGGSVIPIYEEATLAGGFQLLRGGI